jgi:hypothetical protein
MIGIENQVFNTRKQKINDIEPNVHKTKLGNTNGKWKIKKDKKTFQHKTCLNKLVAFHFKTMIRRLNFFTIVSMSNIVAFKWMNFIFCWCELTSQLILWVVKIIDAKEISIEDINGITKQKMKPWKYLNTC